MDYSQIDIYLRIKGQRFDVESLPFIMQGNIGVNSIILFADFDNTEGSDEGAAYIPRITYFDEDGNLIKSNVPLVFKRYIEGEKVNVYKGRIPKAVTAKAGVVRATFSLWCPVSEEEVVEFDTDDLITENGTSYIVSNTHAFEFTVTESGGGGGVRPSF